MPILYQPTTLLTVNPVPAILGRPPRILGSRSIKLPISTIEAIPVAYRASSHRQSHGQRSLSSLSKAPPAAALSGHAHSHTHLFLFRVILSGVTMTHGSRRYALWQLVDIYGATSFCGAV